MAGNANPAAPNFLKMFLAPDVETLKFVFKTLLAAYAAQWITLRFNISKPHWSMMTVFVLAHPMSGMVLTKGVFRFIGTSIACIASIALFAIFPQDNWALITAYTVWITVCIFISCYLRNYAAYAAQLSAYSVAIMAAPHFQEPESIFWFATSRWLDVSIGIGCSVVFTLIFWPKKLDNNIKFLAQDSWNHLTHFIDDILKNKSRSSVITVMSKLLGVETLRDLIWLEGGPEKYRARLLIQFSNHVISLVRTARGICRQFILLNEQIKEEIAPVLEKLGNMITENKMDNIKVFLGEVKAKVYSEQNTDKISLFMNVETLLEKLIQADKVRLALVTGTIIELDPTIKPLSWHRDLQTCLIYTLRALVTIGCVSAFWILSGWNMAAATMMIGAIFVTLFVTFDDIDFIGELFIFSTFLGCIVTLIVSQFFFPRVDGFVMFFVITLPVLYFAAIGMGNSPLGAAFGLGFMVNFLPALLIDNQMHHNMMTPIIIESTMGAIPCILFCWYIFKIISPTHKWILYRIQKDTDKDLFTLTRSKNFASDNTFGGNMATRLLQIANHSTVFPDKKEELWQYGILSIDLEHEIMGLRERLKQAEGPLEIARKEFLEALAHLITPLEKKNRHSIPQLEQLIQKLNMALDQEHTISNLARSSAKSALTQLRYTWQKIIELNEANQIK